MNTAINTAINTWSRRLANIEWHIQHNEPTGQDLEMWQKMRSLVKEMLEDLLIIKATK